MASTIGLTDLFCNTTTPLIGLEIGVLDGHGSKTLLSKLPTLTLHGVDPYAAYKDWDGNIFHGDNATELIAKEKLAEYKKCTDIKKVSIGTHLRYFTTDPETKKLLFRLGGTLNKIDPEGRYVILNNGNIEEAGQEFLKIISLNY